MSQPVTAASGHPLDGDWIIDAARSRWSDGKLPPSMSLRLRLHLEQGRLRYHSENDTDRSRPVMTIDFDAAADGTDHQIHGSTRYDTVRPRQLSPSEFELLELLNDDVIVAAYWRIDDHGTTLWRWGVGKSPAGRSKAYEEVFVKVDRPHDGLAQGRPS